MEDEGGCSGLVKKIGRGWIYFNCFLCFLDRLFQIVYYGVTDFKNNDSVKQTCLTFVLIKPIVNFSMNILHFLFIQEEMIFRKKISNFIKYMFSAEVCYSFWVQTVLENKFEAQEISNNFTITNKVLNVLHMMFCSLPQILIVCIYSSYLGRFIWIDIISLLMSTSFIFWSIIYYIMCSRECIDLDNYYLPENYNEN